MSIKITIPNSSSDVLTFGSGNTPTAAQIAGIDSGSSNGQLALYTTASGTSTERVRVDSSGNVGIGTTPSAWGSSVKAVQLPWGCAIFNIGAGDVAVTQNAYFDNPNFKYASTTGVGSSVYRQIDGTHRWSYSASGTAGNNITFSEAMRIDSSGNLLVGATAAIGDERLYVRATATTGFAFRFYNTQATAGSTFGQYILYSGSSPNGTGNQFLRCDDSTTTRAEIRSNGGIANYSANNVNLASDLRLKHDIEPVQSYWNVFKSIEWKTWLYNDQTDEIKNIGVIAQELQALAPELVCESNALPTPEGESPYLGLWENDFKMAGMSVITELVKRCEEQQAIITSLTDRITALENK